MLYVYILNVDRKCLFNLLFEDVHRSLMGFKLLVLKEDPPPQLQRRRQVRVVAEVTFKEEPRHKAFPKHGLMKKYIHDVRYR